MAGRRGALLAVALPALLALLARPPAALAQRSGAACACACSSRVVRMFTGGRQQDCCAAPCQPAGRAGGPQLRADAARTRRAEAEGRAAAEACANETLQRDAALESARPVRLGTSEFHHVFTLQPLGVEGFRRSVADRCLAASVSAAVANAYNLSNGDVGRQLLELRVTSTGPNPWPTPTCNASARYRTMDGSCNNLRSPAWGRAGRQFNRLLCPRYDDGVWEPPRGRDGGELPNARLLRKTLLPNTPPKAWTDSRLHTLLVMLWGRMVSHDSARTVDLLGVNGLGVQCCAANAFTPTKREPLPRSQTPSSCMPVEGPGSYCLSVSRDNATFVTEDGTVGPGEQDSAINGYLDASFVYGSDDKTAAALRTFTGGRLKTSGDDWLMRSPDPVASCDARNGSDPCFFAGDVRVNQNTQLTVLQILFLREHNRLAGELAVINPHWDDERLYQESRRIVIAEFQHITYDHLVPIYVGPLAARKYNLITDSEFCGYDSEGYNPDVDVTILNEFATASYRVFHGITQSTMKLTGSATKSAQRCPLGEIKLAEWMDKPVAAVHPPGRLDQLVLGMSTQPMQKPRRFIPEALGEHMFETDSDPGQDLAAFDIQRGRDHGLPSYCDYRRMLGGRCCNNWRDLQDHLRPDVVKKMKSLYKHPRDVDLYVGMFLEEPQSFALTGPTATSINLEQFWRWKYGDRFFYSFSGQSGSFSLRQLCELKKATASRLFCDNGDNITSIQPDAFLQLSFFNYPVPCKKIPRINLAAWKE